MPGHDDKTKGQEGRDERAGTTTLDELKDLFNDGHKHMLAAIAGVDRKVTHVDTKVSDLERRVSAIEGHSNPPPAAPGAAVRARVASLPALEGTTAELHGRLLRVESELKDVGAINRAQSKSMGLARPEDRFSVRAGKFLFSREGAKFMLAFAGTVLTFASAMYASRAHEDAARAADRPPVVLGPELLPFVVNDAGVR